MEKTTFILEQVYLITKIILFLYEKV